MEFTQEPATLPAEARAAAQAAGEVDFRHGKVGAALHNAEPLLHIDVHYLLNKRKEQQRTWCTDLQRLGVQRGQSESYTHWEQHQCPIVQQCWTYTSVGEFGVGQGSGEVNMPRQLDKWHRLVKTLKSQELNLKEAWQTEDRTVDFLTDVETICVCNLLPGDSAEAKTIIPSLARFEDNDLDMWCGHVIAVDSAPNE
ncbi:hypothetical protein DIPPA_32970 [Diplonema papillatum]|nr:hypothetical protein DIPPA_32970 [Diplonema papillatum]|eukprot:gene7843-12053_t